MNIINKDGNLNKSYSNKIWNFASKTFCDGFNEEINDEEFKERIEEFYSMLNKIRKENV